jgi:hypothetical protein
MTPYVPPQPMPPCGGMTPQGCCEGSSGELHQCCREYPQRQQHNEQQSRHEPLPFRLCRQACAGGSPATQAPILIGSQWGLAERAELSGKSFGLDDGRRRSAHGLASPRGGRKICVGSSSCTRSAACDSEAGGEEASLALAAEGEEVLTATAGVPAGLAATGGAVGFSGGVEGIAGGVEGTTGGVEGIAGVGAGAVTGAEADAGLTMVGDVASGASMGAGAACTRGATGAVEIGRSALASNASPQPGQKRSLLP